MPYYIFTEATTRSNLVVMTGLWTFASFNYYVIGYLFEEHDGLSLFEALTESSLADITGYTFCGVLLMIVGTKYSFCLSFLISAMLGVCLCFITSDEYFFYILIGTKMMVCGTFTLLFVTTARIFPPQNLCMICGVCNIVAIVMSLLGTYINEHWVRPMPEVIFVVVAVAGSWLSFQLNTV